MQTVQLIAEITSKKVQTMKNVQLIYHSFFVSIHEKKSAARSRRGGSFYRSIVRSRLRPGRTRRKRIQTCSIILTMNVMNIRKNGILRTGVSNIGHRLLNSSVIWIISDGGQNARRTEYETNAGSLISTRMRTPRDSRFRDPRNAPAR